jgi:hypothetical protein
MEALVDAFEARTATADETVSTLLQRQCSFCQLALATHTSDAIVHCICGFHVTHASVRVTCLSRVLCVIGCSTDKSLTLACCNGCCNCSPTAY